MIRIGFLLDHPSPHMVALLNAMAKRDDCIAAVVYIRSFNSSRSWGAPEIELPSRVVPESRFGFFQSIVATIGLVSQARMDAWVVNSVYTTPETWAAAATLSRREVPWVYMNEPPRPSRSKWVKKAMLRLLVSRSRGLIGMGEEPARRYAVLSKGEVPTVSVPYVVELDEFLKLPIRVAREDSVVRFLAVGQLIERKGYDILCAAVSLLPPTGWSLTIVGEGPLRSELEKEFGKVSGRGKVRFMGAVPYEERCRAFAEADVFVFPSRWDGWGMAPVEALAAGLPVIATDQVMSMHDFIVEGNNGFMIPAEDPVALADQMAKFISQPEILAEMKAAARASTDSYQADFAADRLVAFVQQIEAQGQEEGTGASPEARLEAPPNRRSLAKPCSLLGRAVSSIRGALRSAVIGSASIGSTEPTGDRILAYHLVLPEDRRNFDDQIAFLADHFDLVQVMDMAAGKARSDSRPRAAVSFDDTFRILLDDALEVLERRGVKATFYTPTGFVALAGDRSATIDFARRAFRGHHPLEPMRVEDLLELKSLGHEIGSHGVNHLSMSSVSVEMARKELVGSRKQLEEWLGFAPSGFAYPYGDIANPLGAPEEWAADAGYEYGVTMRRGDIRRVQNRMLLPRDHVEGDWPLRHLRYFLSRPSK